MYLRKIGESPVPTYFATNSAGQFMASVKKLDDHDASSWSVAIGPERKEEVVASGLCLEDALDVVHRLEQG